MDKIILNEDRYFGSDLNKFIHFNCKKNMIVNNIDLIMNDYEKNKIRIIESKHKSETLKTGQSLLLKRLNEKFKNSNVKIYIIYADEPYNEIEIHDYNNKFIKTLKNEDVIKFLNFELRLTNEMV